jgi:phosphoglycolate phosphatase
MRKTQMIKMVAFDFDGTIADTIPMCIKAFRQSISPYVGHKLTDHEIIQTFGLNEIGMVKAVVKDNWKLALEDFYLYYEKMHINCTEPFFEICDLIKYLKEKNVIVPLITGKGQKSCYISLKKLGMENCFSEIMVGDETRPNKGECILKLLEKYSIKDEEFYYVGDAISDVMVCREAKVNCLSAAWSHGVELKELKKINSEYVFHSISDLQSFLQSKISDDSIL